MAINWCVLPRCRRARGYNSDKMAHLAPALAGEGVYNSDKMAHFAPLSAGMAVMNLAEYCISILRIEYFTDPIRGKNRQHFFKAINKLRRLLQFGKRIPEHIAFSG